MKKNKGFSLIELIIVIAIMAILVGFMAPLLIKHIEKTRVSSDYQLADLVRTSTMIAVTDVKIIEDTASQPFLAQLESASGMNIDSDASFLSTDCVLKDSLEEMFGVPTSNLVNSVRSAHGGGCHINVKIINETCIRVTITETDMTARRDKSSGTPANDITVE